jgi:hypothetical protein
MQRLCVGLAPDFYCTRLCIFSTLFYLILASFNLSDVSTWELRHSKNAIHTYIIFVFRASRWNWSQIVLASWRSERRSCLRNVWPGFESRQGVTFLVKTLQHCRQGIVSIYSICHKRNAYCIRKSRELKKQFGLQFIGKTEGSNFNIKYYIKSLDKGASMLSLKLRARCWNVNAKKLIIDEFLLSWFFAVLFLLDLQPIILRRAPRKAKCWKKSSINSLCIK